MLDLTKDRVDKVLLKFTLPMFISVIFQQMYNMADSLIAGKFAGENALAAVGASYPITMILMSVALGTGIGTMVIISHFYGRKAYKRMKSAISTILISTVVISIILSALALAFSTSLLAILNTPDNIFIDSKKYLDIYIYGFLSLYLYNVITGIFTSMGDSQTPLYMLIASSLLNILLDYVFVAKFNWGVAGVAYATLFAQTLSFIVSAVFLWFRLKTIKTDKFAYFSIEELKNISVIAIPSILQQSFISIGNIFIQARVNSFGSSTVAGFAAANKLNTFVITSFTTIGNAVSSFSAQNIGAQKYDRIKNGFKAALKIGLTIAITFFLIFFIKGDFLMSLFLKEINPQTINVGHDFLKIVSPFYVVSALKLVADGVLRASKKMKEFMTATFVDLLLRVILAFVLSYRFGSLGIWLSWPIGWVIATGLSFYYYKNLVDKGDFNG